MHPPILYLFSAVYDTACVGPSFFDAVLQICQLQYLVQVYWAAIIRGVASCFFQGGVIHPFSDCKYLMSEGEARIANDEVAKPLRGSSPRKF